MFQSIWGVFALVIIAAIVFVKAGQFGGQNGGEQSATIIKAGGGALSSVISSGAGNPAASAA